MEKHDLAERSRHLGQRTLKRCREMMSRLDVIGDVRGRGLYVGVELIKRGGSKAPDPDLLVRLQKECFSNGLVAWKGGRSGNVARIMPALVITEELLDAGLSIFETGLKKVMAR
jgi:4-aminobutyrate aminotransferase-like enzyme